MNEDATPPQAEICDTESYDMISPEAEIYDTKDADFAPNSAAPRPENWDTEKSYPESLDDRLRKL